MGEGRAGRRTARRAAPLGDDLDSGRWAARNGDLVARDSADLGLRQLVA
ncbi:hypothetical protein [Actinospica acidiphila]|nr:hypothetical protein [Actinospica acidiphila]